MPSDSISDLRDLDPAHDTPAAGRGRERGSWLRQLAVVILLALVGVAVYANSFKSPFVFDSAVHILENPAIKHVWQWCSPVAITHLQGGNRPVGFLSFALNYAWRGYDAWSFHAVNLAIHLAAAWLLFDTVRRTLSRGRLAARYAAHAWGLALAIALVWLIHPLQTQSVTYIYQRLESQMGLFYLATLWCFVRALDSPWPRGWYVASVAFCVLGAGTKEVIATAPLIVLWYDRVFAASSWREIFAKRAAYYAALISTWGLLALLMLARWADFQRGDVLIVKNVSPLDYARSQPAVILHYLRLAFWPDQLCLDYGWPVAQGWSQMVPQSLAIGALLALTIWSAYRWPPWGFLGGWFFLILAPSSSVAPIADLAVEHRMYLSLAAVVTLVVMACYHAGGYLMLWLPTAVDHRPQVARGLAVVLLVATVAALGLRSIRRNEDYRSVRVIWEDTLRQRPFVARPYQAMAHLLLGEGQTDQALQLLNKAIELKPDFVDAYNDRGNLYQYLGQSQRALDDYGRAIAINPVYFAPYNNRGNVLSKSGRAEDLLAAVNDFTKAIELNDQCAGAYNDRGAAYYKLGKNDLAVQDLDRAVELQPDVAATYSNRGLAYRELGQLTPAFNDFDRAIELDPTFAPAYAERAMAYYLVGRYKRAWADVRTAQKLGGSIQPFYLQMLEQAAPAEKFDEPPDEHHDLSR